MVDTIQIVTQTDFYLLFVVYFFLFIFNVIYIRISSEILKTKIHSLVRSFIIVLIILVGTFISAFLFSLIKVDRFVIPISAILIGSIAFKKILGATWFKASLSILVLVLIDLLLFFI